MFVCENISHGVWGKKNNFSFQFLFLMRTWRTSKNHRGNQMGLFAFYWTSLGFSALIHLFVLFILWMLEDIWDLKQSVLCVLLTFRRFTTFSLWVSFGDAADMGSGLWSESGPNPESLSGQSFRASQQVRGVVEIRSHDHDRIQNRSETSLSAADSVPLRP